MKKEEIYNKLVELNLKSIISVRKEIEKLIYEDKKIEDEYCYIPSDFICRQQELTKKIESKEESTSKNKYLSEIRNFKNISQKHNKILDKKI